MKTQVDEEQNSVADRASSPRPAPDSDAVVDAVGFDYDKAEAERLHAFEPNTQCSGTTCDVCDETKEWHDKRDEVMRRRREFMPDYDERLKRWLS